MLRRQENNTFSCAAGCQVHVVVQEYTQGYTQESIPAHLLYINVKGHTAFSCSLYSRGLLGELLRRFGSPPLQCLIVTSMVHRA